jgi:biopolymer transport protein ExbD
MLAIDMTPMIDIVFQLLIFFLVTSHMVEVARTDVDLPQERGEEDSSEELSGLVVNVLASGELVVGDAPRTLAELGELARRLGASSDEDASSRRPLVRADRNAPAETLNAVIGTLERAGARSIRLATSPNGGGGS